MTFIPRFRTLAWALCLFASALRAAHAGEIELAKISDPTDGDGVVVASLSVSTTEILNYATFSLLEGEGNFKVDQFTLGRPLFSINETLSGADGRWGRVIAIKLRPGKYRFGPVNASMLIGPRGEMRHTEDLQRGFTVEPNKLLYLGNLDILLERNPELTVGAAVAIAIFGGGVYQAAGLPHVRDSFDADLKIVRQAQGSIEADVFEKRLMRDARDDAIEQTIAEVSAAKAAGQAWAKALWTEAAVFGYTQLPDLRFLRLPATLGFDPQTVEDFIATGDPHLLNLMAGWAMAPNAQMWVRTPIVLEPAALKRIALASANRYSVLGLDLLNRLDSQGLGSDSLVKAGWTSRDGAVRKRHGLYKNELLETLVGPETAKRFEQSKAKRKLLAVAPSGRAFMFESDGLEPLAPAIAGHLQQCQDATREICWIAATNQSVKPPVCSAFMQATGFANTYPEHGLPNATLEFIAGKAWEKSYLSWMQQGRAAEIHPRALVWDVALDKGFGASGDCLSAHRAMQACKADGGKACEVVVMDDQLVSK